MNIPYILFQSLYFMLPAYIANMMPVIASAIPFGNKPIDHGKSWRGARILGDHKTVRGFIAGIIAAIITVFIQKSLAGYYFFDSTLVPFETFSSAKTAALGFALGFGALAGDAIKSFFKRRLKRPPGSPWFPFDQLDFVIGSLIAASIFYIPPPAHVLIIFIATPLLHFLTNVTAYFLGIKKVWW